MHMNKSEKLLLSSTTETITYCVKCLKKFETPKTKTHYEIFPSFHGAFITV